jgi:hypothetical protein
LRQADDLLHGRSVSGLKSSAASATLFIKGLEHTNLVGGVTAGGSSRERLLTNLQLDE